MENPRTTGHRAPLLWVLLPFLVGITLPLPELPPILLVPALAAALTAAITAPRRPAAWALCLSIALIFAGAFWRQRQTSSIADHLDWPPREFRGLIAVSRVFETSDPSRASGIGRIVLAVSLGAPPIGSRVHFSARIPPGSPALVFSSVHEVSGVLAPLDRGSPWETFSGYLRSQGAESSLSRARLLRLHAPAGRYRTFCHEARQRLAKILRAGIVGKRPELTASLQGMMLGLDAEISPAQEERFRRTGTYHVFSISGLHIAAIATGIYALLDLLRIPRLLRFLAGGAVLWLYVDITGAPASPVRACFMMVLLDLARCLRKPVNPIACLCAAALLILVPSPLQAFSAGFQLSYGIVATLVMFGLPLAERWKAAWHPWEALPEADRRWWHRWTVTSVGWAAAASALTLATWVPGTVMGIRYFGIFTPGGLVANLLFIPAASLAILAGFCSLLCGMSGLLPLSSLFNHAAAILLLAGEFLLGLVEGIPGAWFIARFREAWIGEAAQFALLGILLAGYSRSWRNPVPA
jgi:competence protein ComEC